MGIDLHSLPRLEDSISFIYIEHAVIEKRDESVEIIRKGNDNTVERIPVPIAKTTSVLLVPGTSISHAAISVMAEVGCSCVWCGEQLRKFYASGIGETNSSKNIMLQAKLCMNETMHMEVVKRMYKMRFPDFSFVEKMTLKQMRGMEGTRMKSIYKVNAARTGIEWKGRNYTPKALKESDLVNQALTINNSLLYAICHASIVSLGFSPALGFIHTGNAMSFVYDVADLYKADTTIPAAFDAAKQYQFGGKQFDSFTREICRNYFLRKGILKTISKDIGQILGADVDNTMQDAGNDLWMDDFKVLKGGVNYADYKDNEDEEW